MISATGMTENIRTILGVTQAGVTPPCECYLAIASGDIDENSFI